MIHTPTEGLLPLTVMKSHCPDEFASTLARLQKLDLPLNLSRHEQACLMRLRFDIKSD